MGSMPVWQLAQYLLVTCCSRYARPVSPEPDTNIGSCGTSGGGDGGGSHSRCSSTQLPRLTGDVRLGCEVVVRKVSWVRMPPRPLPVRLTCAKVFCAGGR